MGNVGRHYYQWRYAARHAANLDTHYDVRISVGPVPQRITQIVEDLAFTNRTGRTMDRVVLHAPWHHWDGVLTLRSATAQGSPAAARWREDINLEVALPVPVAAGGQVSLSLSFDARPRPVGGRTGYDRTNDILCLGDMLPTLVPWENGGWSYFPYSELGDLGFYETSSYEVEISSTGGERLIVGGAGSLASVDDARTRWRFEALQVRDVAYIISPHFMDPRTNSSMTRQAGSTRILAYFPPEHPQDGRRQLDLVAPAVSWFSRTLGAYPFDTYTVAEMGIPLKRTDNYAQEYPMSYWIPTPWLRLGTTPGSWTWYTPVHEVGHQWFYSLIGNNQLTDPWLDEAMTSYITAEYVRANFPDQYQSTWSSTTIRPGKAKPVSAGVFSGFANENEYSATVYNSGVLMLGEVHRAMGNEAFYAALRDYYSRFKYRRATPADLIGVLQAHTGTDLSPIFGRYLGY
jgi:hypothetical protein